MPRCKICHTDHGLDGFGRCPSCADAAQATALGMHYGDYMAKKGAGTVPDTPRRAKFYAALLDYEETRRLPPCRICGGNVFPPRRYLCSPKCELEDKRRKARTRKDPDPRICPVCGKPVLDRRRTYCCETCTQTAAREHDRIYRAKRRQKGTTENDQRR